MTTRNAGDDSGVDAKVSGIDLESLKRKLVEEKGWDVATIGELERQYRKFLGLKLRFPARSIVPTRFIDEMWHAHILDTRAYAEDCQRVFGYFLHHFPYLGVGGESEKAKLDDAFQSTVDLWATAYSEDYRELPAGVRLSAGLLLDQPTEAGRCKDHSCHAPSSCACRSPGACKDES